MTVTISAVRSARVGYGLVAMLAIVGCVVPYSELPLCPRLEMRDTPLTSCTTSEAVEEYRSLLAHEVLRRSQWEYSGRQPLHVKLDADRRVRHVCFGDAASKPGWSSRDRVASSLRSLRALGPGPECVASTTIDLTSTLVTHSVSDRTSAALPPGMTHCADYRNIECTNQPRHVCAVFHDGRRSTYPNACLACRSRSVVGFFDFRCD